MRKHYMTLCARGNSDIEITHIKKNGEIEVTCEQATNGGFNTLVMALDGKIMLWRRFGIWQQRFV